MDGFLQYTFQFPVIHRLQQILESLHIIRFKHILPAGRYKNEYLIRCLFTQNLCCFHPIQIPHNDIKENNIKISQCLQQFPSTSKLADDAWYLHFFHNFFYSFRHVIAFYDFIITNRY